MAQRKEKYLIVPSFENDARNHEDVPLKKADCLVTRKVESWVGMKGFPTAFEVNMKIGWRREMSNSKCTVT
jgi:hypothetical protein